MQNLLVHLPSKFLIAFVLLIFLGSCDKDSVLVDSDIDPGGNLNLQEVDSFVLTAITVEEKELSSDNTTDVWLGVISDTRTGLRKSQLFTELRLTQTGIDIGANAILDSAFIYFNYSEIYGPGIQALDFEVYEVLDSIEVLTNYETDDVLAIGTSPLASAIGVTLSEDGGIIKLPLESSFASTLFAQIGTANMENNTNFTDYFNGLNLQVSSTTGDAMARLNLTNVNTGLELFYRSDDPEDSVYRFQIDNQAKYFMNYQEDFMGSNVETVLNDPSNNDSELYITGFSGTKGQVEMPDLSFYADKVINYAEISFTQADYGSTESTDFPEQNNLFVYQNLYDTTFTFLTGFTTSNFTAFGGGKELVDVGGTMTNRYKFNITQYVQALSKGELETSSIYVTSLSNNNPRRIVIGGGNHPQFPIKLKILFTLTN